jgi:hypothetical protein
MPGISCGPDHIGQRGAPPGALVMPSGESGPMSARGTAVVLVLAVVAAYLAVNVGVALVRDWLS